MVGIILTQLKQSTLCNFKKLIISIDFDIIDRSMVGLRVDEHKTYQKNPKKAERISCKVWK